MADLSQYFMLTSVIAAFPILFIGSVLIYRQRKDSPSIILLLGAALIVIGGFVTGYGLLESWGASIGTDLEQYALIQSLMATGGVTTSGGLTIFALGFIYLSILLKKE